MVCALCICARVQVGGYVFVFAHARNQILLIKIIDSADQRPAAIDPAEMVDAVEIHAGAISPIQLGVGRGLVQVGAAESTFCANEYRGAGGRR